MSKKTLLITDFFPKSHPSTASHASLLGKPIKQEAIVTFPIDTQQEAKSSIPARLKFVRHHSAPLHHRSPVKMRERLMEQQDLSEIRERIHAFRNDLSRYKATHGRSPIKRLHTSGEIGCSPVKLSTPLKRFIPTTVHLPHHFRDFSSYPSTPAYERFSPLAAAIELPLPDKYKLLFEQYKHLDFLVCHTHNTGGISTFDKLQRTIQEKTKRYDFVCFSCFIALSMSA